jgi:hypothetical protein
MKDLKNLASSDDVEGFNEGLKEFKDEILSD